MADLATISVATAFFVDLNASLMPLPLAMAEKRHDQNDYQTISSGYVAGAATGYQCF